MKNTTNGKLYVIKKLCRNISGIREARVLSRLRHPNLIRVYGAGEDSTKGILITEYVQGGSLADRLIKPFPVKQALEIFRQAATGLSYAHKNGIVHGNLRPSNVLFDGSNRIKLTDFALPEHYIKKKGNWYGAPERQKSIASDIYSVGVMLYQLLTARIPDIRAGGDLAWKSRSHDGRFSLLNIMSQMLERDPRRRPVSFDKILQLIEELGYLSPETHGSTPIDQTMVIWSPNTWNRIHPVKGALSSPNSSRLRLITHHKVREST